MKGEIEKQPKKIKTAEDDDDWKPGSGEENHSWAEDEEEYKPPYVKIFKMEAPE